MDQVFLDLEDACAPLVTDSARGSVILGDEMIDEASRKLALVIVGKGRAAGMQRTSAFQPPAQSHTYAPWRRHRSAWAAALGWITLRSPGLPPAPA